MQLSKQIKRLLDKVDIQVKGGIKSWISPQYTLRFVPLDFAINIWRRSPAGHCRHTGFEISFFGIWFELDIIVNFPSAIWRMRRYATR